MSEEEEILLLRHISSAGGSVRVLENVDHRPYRNMLRRGWLKSHNATTRETIYEITRGGRTALNKLDLQT